MGLVRKIFSGNAAKGPSSQSGKDDPIVLERAPRITITPLHNISFHLREPFELPDIKVGNISSTGIGFLRDTMSEELKDIDIFKGDLVHHGNDSKIETRNVHCTPKILGCAFLRNFDAVKGVIHRYFNLELAAMDLAKVSHNVLKKVPDGTPHWFQKRGDCELYYVEDGAEIVRFNLTFFGNYIEFERGKELVYGRIVDEEPEDQDEPRRYGFNEFVLAEPAIPPDVVVGAVNFVMNIEGLSSEYEKFICGLLSRAGSGLNTRE